ncbi:MAG: hypothetical protein H6560_26780 [Lewinellaceae bacterium]|nr:hypothetical protein [Lewinellaceae bacterium]
MTAIEIRPRFQEQVPLSKEEALERLRAALKQPGSPIIGYVADHHVTLKIPYDKQHFWSPQLALEVETHESGEGALVRGLFGPRPSVWLMFVFMYSIIGVICLFVAITGFSQLSLGIPAPALWVLPIGGALAIVLYLSAKTGERLGEEEMHQLKLFLNQVLMESETAA